MIFILSLIGALTLTAQSQYNRPISRTIKGPQLLDNLDCSLNYDQYFKNDSIDVNGYYVYAHDSLHYFTSDTAVYYDLKNAGFNQSIDTRNMHQLKHGSWSEQFEVNKKNWLLRTKTYQRVGTYVAGYLYGKMYTFDDEMKIRMTFQRYPIINDTVFYGSQITRYDDKKNVVTIEFVRFNDAADNQTFKYHLSYDEEGTLKQYTYQNDKHKIIEEIKYDDNGQQRYALKKHGDQSIQKKWSHNRKRLKVIQKNNRKTIKHIYRKGELIRSSQKK